MRSSLYIDPRLLKKPKKAKAKGKQKPRAKREHKGRCDPEVWKDFTPGECEIWHQIFMDSKSGLLMPEGLHFTQNILREIAAQYATQAIWAIRKTLIAQEEKRKKQCGTL
jgi:hypothetical protein